MSCNRIHTSECILMLTTFLKIDFPDPLFSGIKQRRRCTAYEQKGAGSQICHTFQDRAYPHKAVVSTEPHQSYERHKTDYKKNNHAGQRNRKMDLIVLITVI